MKRKTWEKISTWQEECAKTRLDSCAFGDCKDCKKIIEKMYREEVY